MATEEKMKEKVFLILDWVDDKILRHRFYSICCFIAMHLLDKTYTDDNADHYTFSIRPNS